MITFWSYGTGHGQLEVDVELIFPLAHRFYDPAGISDELRNLTGEYEAVTDSVMGQPGAVDYLEATVDAVRNFAFRYPVASGNFAWSCRGGRHRSVVFAIQAAKLHIARYGGPLEVIHRDIRKPILPSRSEVS